MSPHSGEGRSGPAAAAKATAKTAPAAAEQAAPAVPGAQANYGVKLQEKLLSLKVPCELVYPGAPDVKHPTIDAFLIETLKK